MGSGLLVVDVQTGVVQENPGSETVLPTIVALVNAARAAGRPVLWVQHDDDDLVAGSDGWQIVSALGARSGELHVRKQHRSAFGDTGLGAALRDRGVDRIVLVGVQSAFCVDLAGKHALTEGLDVTLVSDAHANGPLETAAGTLSDQQVRAMVNRTWATLSHPGRRVEVTPAADVAW
ncbi:MAG: isochorismatase family protein [Lapillicoccus sp.]